MKAVLKKFWNKYVLVNMILLCISFSIIAYNVKTHYLHYRECMLLNGLLMSLMVIVGAFCNKSKERRGDFIVCIVCSALVLVMTIYVFFRTGRYL